MNELSMHTSKVIEFVNLPQMQLNKNRVLADSATNTDFIVKSIDVGTETTRKQEAAVQTEQLIGGNNFPITEQDERVLNNVLRKLAKLMESALEENCTPIPKDIMTITTTNYNVQPYQSINLQNITTNPTTESAKTTAATIIDATSIKQQVLACWLGIYTNNAPALIISTVAAHDNWCEHIDEQYLQLYIPKRMTTRAVFLLYQHVKSIPLKACLHSICVNNFDKSIFAGAMLNNHITIWQHLTNTNDIIELHSFNTITVHGCAIDMSWSTIDQLLTCHNTGYVLHWHLGQKMTLQNEFAVRDQNNDNKADNNDIIRNNELCALVSLSAYAFVVGSKSGYIYYCRHRVLIGRQQLQQLLDIMILYKQDFMITKLIRILHNNCHNIISCDLSGEVIVHDLFYANDDYNQDKKLSYRLPLPFKNAICCPKTQELNTIYCPGNDGAIECFNIQNRTHIIVKGALQAQGSGNFIECSDNGNWIVSGLYGNELQIFYVDN